MRERLSAPLYENQYGSRCIAGLVFLMYAIFLLSICVLLWSDIAWVIAIFGALVASLLMYEIWLIRVVRTVYLKEDRIVVARRGEENEVLLMHITDLIDNSVRRKRVPSVIVLASPDGPSRKIRFFPCREEWRSLVVARFKEHPWEMILLNRKPENPVIARLRELALNAKQREQNGDGKPDPVSS